MPLPVALLPPATVLGGSIDLGAPSVSFDDGATALWIAVPLLLGLAIGWFGRRRLFGVAVTAIGVVGFTVTWCLADRGVGFHSRDSDGFDELADALLSVVIYASLLLSFGLVGLLGLGALAGSALRGPAPRAGGPEEPAVGTPAGRREPPAGRDPQP